MSAANELLVALPGVSGLCHIRSGEIVWWGLPDGLSPDRAVALCGSVNTAFGVYAGAGRVLREVWLEFPGIAVLVLGVAPGELLIFFVSDRSAAPGITKGVRQIAASNS